MNTHSVGNAAPLRLTSNAVIAVESPSIETVVMTCEACDLVGGSFPPAEAAYLKAIHNRVHHGYGFSVAA
jgi:hypothetical protein